MKNIRMKLFYDGNMERGEATFTTKNLALTYLYGLEYLAENDGIYIVIDEIEIDGNLIDIDELAIAVASAPKGITNSLEVNDVVFVGFEDNNIATPVILGQLYNEKLLKQHNLHIQARSIDIEESVNLPIGTTLNADINLYDYIVKLKEQVDALELQIKQLAAR